MKKSSKIKHAISRRTDFDDGGINLTIVLFVFASIATKLYLGNRITPLISLVLVAILVFTLYLGSITKTVLVGVVSILSTALVISVFKSLSYLLLNPFPFLILFSLIALICTLLIKYAIDLEVRWKSEFLSVTLSFLALTLIWNSRLTLNGGPVAALYGSEDNAAWVLSIHRVINNDEFPSGGDFGSLMDSLLVFSYHLGNFVLPDLSPVDHVALSVVILQIVVVCFIPFLPSLLKLTAYSERSTLFSHLVLSLMLLICFRTFNQYGHLSTALSCLLISIYLILGFQLSDEVVSQNRRHFSLYLQMSIAYLAGVTWFPIAPLAIALILFTFCRLQFTSANSRFSKIVFLVFGTTLSSLLFFEELLQRFKFFETPGSGEISGAKNLLSFEGGVVSSDPWSVSLVVAFALIVMTIMVLLRIKTSMYLSELGLAVSYVMLLTMISTVLFNGNVTYGARKVTVLVVFCGATLLTWALVSLVESRLREFVTPLVPGVLVLSLILAMPGAGAFAGGKYFAGFERDDFFEQAKQLVRNVEIGRSTVCFSEATEEQAPGLGGPSYTCSRWAAAYSFRDGQEFNEWRKAVLGQIPSEDLIGVRKGLPSNTMLIVLGPENPQRELNNENWVKLVDKEWTIVR